VGEIADALRRARQESNRGIEPRRAPDQRPEAAQEAAARTAMPPASGESSPPLGPPLEAAVRAGDSDVHIPDLKKGSWAGRAVLADPHGRFAMHFRQFALRVGRELERRGTRAVLVTSAVNQDGKTTTACNLALAMASMAAGRRIALVELDLRRPAMFQALGVARPKRGFECVLRGEALLEAAVLRSDAGVDLFLVAKPVDKAHEVLARPECGASIRALVRSYDQIVFDTPPVMVVPDVSLIIPHVEACVTVARAGATPLSAFRAMIEVLPSEKIIGAFVNNARSSRDFAQYDRYYDSREGSRAE
jgi:Mrp family chromosome partitioning ATPase